MKQWYKTAVVIFGAIVFSTVAIQAGDVLRNIDGGLAGLVTDSLNEDICGEGEMLVHLASGALCVDVYEASASDSCSILSPNTQSQTQDNLNDFACISASKADRIPWRFVSLVQAQQLCARSGKRLPTNEEWYALAVSTGSQQNCVTDTSGPGYTGASQCMTQSGIYDMIGNVWEWVDAEIVDGEYNGRKLPESGFVQLVDTQGVVLNTGSVADNEFGQDYAMTNSSGIYGMIRGGYYGSGEDAGIFAQNLSVPLNLKTDGIGFRCVKSI